MTLQIASVKRRDSARPEFPAGGRRHQVQVALRLLMLFVMLVSLTGMVQAQEDSCSYCKPRVQIGFNGAFCSSGHYRMYISGTLVAAGSASCDAAAYGRSNDILAGLILDVTYQIQVIGACATHINFYDIPDEYYVEIDGKEGKTIDKAGVSIGEGDGIWNITVRRKCECGNGNAGESPGTKLGSIMWDVGLGKLSDGRSAGHLGIHAESLAAYHATPLGLIYSPPGYTNEVDVVRNPDFTLRQVKSPEALADVISINSDEYEVRFYRHADVGAKDANGIYTVSNQPFVTWRITNPSPGSVSQLQISKIQNGVTQSNLYTWNSSTNIWSLATGTGERTESKATVIDPTTGEKTETFTVTNAGGQVVSKLARTYHVFTWSTPELIREVVDPDGAALTTTYAYYQVSTEVGRHRRVKSVTNPDGSWEQYDYDSTGNRVLVLRPWKDQALATATEANSYAIRTTYSNYDGINVSLDPKFVSSVEEKVAGATVRKTVYSRTGTTVNGEPAVIESQTVYASAAVGLTTVTTTYHSSASNFFTNRVASVQYPDGRKDSYIYEKGNYVTNADPSLNEFTPDPNGAAQRDTVVHGTSASPDGVAFKTTKETTVRDQFGHVALQEVYVYTGSGHARVSWSAMSYDDRGHLTQTRRSNGTVATSTWDGDRKTADVDENGIETQYSYDSLNRIATQTRKGVSSVVGGFPAQADVVTTYTYDAEGRTKTQTTSAGGLSLVTATTYDVAGRVKTETDAAGLVTTHTYTNGGRTETITLPGAATRISDKYLDGQSKSVLGTATITQFFDYGVNADGTPYTQEFIGSAGVNSPRWTKISSDWMGRTIKVERPSFIPGSNVIQFSTYNALGQLQTESVMVGANKLQADKIYEYDALSNQIRVGSDIDASGALTLSSSDRISETDSLFQQNGSDWFRVSTNKTYLTNGNPTSTTITTQSERLNNFAVNGAENTISDSTTTDVAGNQTRTITVVDRAGKKLTTRTDTPDSATDAVSVTYNGLLQSSIPAVPVSPSTFTYDALARPIGISDPATGSSTKAYSSSTGQLISESHGSQTTSYEYFSASEPNAGRLKAKTDPHGKKVYFNYNSRGEMFQSWGDTTYPIEYVFDAYGQKTEMHTFRGGSGWQGSSWPVATVGTMDITRWIYQEATGLLTTKQDASTKQVLYTYDTLGRIVTRRWARLGGASPIVTTYSYDPNSGDMTGISYSDGTQPVAFTYDRGGRQATITDAAGAHTLTHNTAGQLQSDQITGGLLDGTTVTVGYDAFLRRGSLQSTRNAATLTSQTYGYDTSSRLETVNSGSQTATYAYYPATGLLNTTTFTGGTQMVRSYDALGRLQTIATTTPALGTIASYTYTYNNLDQRTHVTREDNSYWSYVYNDRGELTSGKKYWSDNSLVAGQQTEYVFDSIGNRTSAKAGGDPQGLNLRQATYTANSLNQYQQRTVPGALDILGTANAAATVTVNDQPTYRRGDYFYKELAVDNTLAPAYPQVKAVGVRSGAGGAGEDAVTQMDGHIYVPKNVEVYSYDDDGNLTSDGRWTYTWDAENRLSSMQALTATPVAARFRLEFAYDAMGRRIQKTVYAWNVGAGAYQLQSTTRFVYDGWSLIAELDGSNSLVRSYTRGRGELLLVSANGNVYEVGYDGNENVSVLINASTGALSAIYDYDPFGQTVKSSGEYASQNPFRFSGQYQDAETGLNYYGYRYYNPQTGRWISRDPSEEEGGSNINGFLGNDAVNGIDLLGLWKRDSEWAGGWNRYSGTVIADGKCDSLKQLAYRITGSQSDWTTLGIPDEVKPGQVVSVAPLLNKLESKLRPNVVGATARFRAAGFGPLLIIVGASPSQEVNEFFKRKSKLKCDCLTAANAVLKKGLLNLVGSGLFDRLNQSLSSMFASKTGFITEMLPGDMGWFPNYSDYLEKVPGGGFQAENVIKVGRDAYWGFTGVNQVKSQAQWEAELRNAFNRPSGRRVGVQRRGPIPGFSQKIQIDFLNVANIGEQLFDLRDK